MLDYLVTGRAKRELFRLVWGDGRSGSVSSLARAAQVNFSAAHRELEAMRVAGLVESERQGAELRYRAAAGHPQADLLRQLARGGDSPRTPSNAARTPADDDVRGWLQQLGAPIYAPEVRSRAPRAEETLSRALVLSHSDPEMARVLPLVLWRQRADLDLELLADAATKLNERSTLGYFLELAGSLGKDRRLMEASKALVDRRRRRPRMFFSGPHGRRELAAAQERTPRVARRWGYLISTGVDSFKSVFDKFATR